MMSEMALRPLQGDTESLCWRLKTQHHMMPEMALRLTASTKTTIKQARASDSGFFLTKTMGNKKKNIIKTICDSAKLYKENLAGKTFLYVLEDGRYIEVMFLKRNFKHLTGVDSPLSANDFYKKATKGQLGVSQITFTTAHPYRLAARKLNHINNISNAVMNEVFVLEEVTTTTKIYRFGTTDMNLTLCLGDEESSPCLVPTSLRDEDCFSKCKDAFSVTHIFMKQNGEKKYTKKIYEDKQNSRLPDSIIDLVEIKEK